MKPIYIHKKLRSLIAIGYCLVIALTCIIVYIYQHEQNQFNELEKESNYLHIMQQKIHDAYASLLDKRTCFLFSGHRPLYSKTANNIFVVTEL